MLAAEGFIGGVELYGFEISGINPEFDEANAEPDHRLVVVLTPPALAGEQPSISSYFNHTIRRYTNRGSEDATDPSRHI